MDGKENTIIITNYKERFWRKKNSIKKINDDHDDDDEIKKMMNEY
jgi:hypothetical protein